MRAAPTSASCRSRPIAQSSVAARERALEPGRVQVDRDLGRFARPLEAALLGRREDAVVPAATISSKKAGSSVGGVDLDLLPAADLRDGRPGLGLLEVGGDRLEPAGDGVEALGRAGAWSRANSRNRLSPTWSRANDRCSQSAQLVDVEDRPADVVDLELALDAGLRARARRGRWPRPRPGARARPRARRGPPRGCRRRGGRRPGGGRPRSPRTGLSRMSRTKRVSTRSYSVGIERAGGWPASGRGSGAACGASVTELGSSWAGSVVGCRGSARVRPSRRPRRCGVSRSRRLGERARVASMVVSMSAAVTP